MKNTLLIAASGPGISGVGGVLIRDMLQSEGVDRVSLAAMVPAESAGQLDAVLLDTVTIFTPPPESYEALPVTSFHTLKKWSDRRWRYDVVIKKLAAQFVDHIRTKKPERVWVILNSTTVIDVLYLLLPHLACELLVQVWDDPEHLCRQRNIDRFSRQRTAHRFRSILKKAKRTAVICEEMAEAYRAVCPGDYIVVRHGLVDAAITPRTDPANAAEFRIGLSGSMYSPASWKALQKALDQINWRLDNRQVVLVVVGGKIDFVSRSSAECRFYGWRPPEVAMQMMTECDLLYLPQAFEANQQALTRLSFPTKLSAYAATGRPILVHTPEYGSLARFCREHNAGVLCHSLNPQEIIPLLHRCADADFRSGQAKAVCRIGSSVLTRRQFQNGVRKFLGIEPTAASKAPADK